VRALADSDFDSKRPLQTKRGALKTVEIDRIVRVTTESILAVASGERRAMETA